MAVTGVAMLGTGVCRLFLTGGAEPVILRMFGSIGLTLALSERRDWRAWAIIGRARIARQVARMLAGSFATVTAAVVVNVSFLLPFVVWLGRRR